MTLLEDIARCHLQSPPSALCPLDPCYAARVSVMTRKNILSRLGLLSWHIHGPTTKSIECANKQGMKPCMNLGHANMLPEGGPLPIARQTSTITKQGSDLDRTHPSHDDMTCSTRQYSAYWRACAACRRRRSSAATSSCSRLRSSC